MNRKGSAVIILIIIVVVVLLIGIVWYYESQKPVSTLPANIPQPTATPIPFSFSCPQSGSTTLTAYENHQMGIAFCYPSDIVVTTNTITWTQASSTPLTFWILHEPFAVEKDNFGNPILFGDLADCDASGAKGEDYCVFPLYQNQIMTGENLNGFNWALFRHDIVENATSDILSSEGGPSAFVPLINQNYLVFTPANSLFQATGFAILPASTNDDLEEILNTVAIMPQQYTGVGLTLTTNTAGKIDVYNVIANSPALAAGVKDGDIITGINGTSTASMSLDDVTNLLDTATGTININVQEGNRTSTLISLTPATFVVSGSDLGAMYEKPF